MKKQICWVLLIPVFFFLNCNPAPYPAATGETTFTIQQPRSFECYKERQQQGAPKTRVSLMINAKSLFYNGNRLVSLDEETITVDPNVTPFPITVTLTMPNDGKIGEVEVTMDGLDCSDCANGYGDPAETTGSCPSLLVPNTNPWQYRAAKPRWYDSFTIRDYASTNNIPAIRRHLNVSNSCNCNVQ